RLALPRRARGDAEAAVAHHGARHAEGDGRRERRIPGDLRVVMRVEVDDAGHEREAARVDIAPRRLVGLTDADNPALAYTDRRCDGFRAAAVIDPGAAKEHVQHVPSLRDNASALQEK